MFENLKKGFGFTVGGVLGYVTMKLIANVAIKFIVNDDKYIEKLKKENPDLYKEVIKYKTNKEES